VAKRPRTTKFGERPVWEPATPRLRPVRLVVSWIVAAGAVWVAAAILPGFELHGFWAPFLVAAVIAVLNAIVPPVLAALRLPFMIAVGFILVLVADALIIRAAHAIFPGEISLGSFGDAFLAALLIAAANVVLAVIIGTNDDDEYTVRVTRRVARRQGATGPTDVPGILYLEIDGLALPILRDAMRDGSAPVMARWIADDGFRVAEWSRTSPRRPAPARPASCSAPTRTSPPSAGSRRRPG